MPEPANPGRERILRRIAGAKRGGERTRVEHGGVFPPIGDLLQRFQSECKGNLTECVLCDDDIRRRIEEQLQKLPVGPIFAEDCAWHREVLSGCLREVRWSSEGPPREFDVATITSTHALIAQSGSLLVSSGCGGRGATVVAPVHIVAARESQLVADLDEALELAVKLQLPEQHSFVGVITGCSRTGDIEKLLVLGAHGPKKLVVLVERRR
jgi:L-lactate dehydrogenase complex protein LldG